jgi:hypothetical protein
VQDDYKVTPRLTLNIGLRWDVLGARTERHNKLDYTFNTSVLNTVANAQIQATNPTVNPNPIQFPTAVAPSTGFVSAYSGGLEFVGVNGNPRGEYATQYGNFQPTIGAAYSINNKTSIRGGFRTLYFNNENTDSNTGFTGSTSYLNTINQINPYGGEPGGSFPNGALADPFPTFSPASGSSLGYLTNLGNTFSFINPYYHLPRLMSYSVTLQRLLGSRDTLDVSYSGNQASGLDSSININPPSAAFQATCDPERGGFRENCDSTNAATVYPTTGLSGYYGLVPNPFHNVLAFSGSSYYTATTMTKLNMTRPFPMFGDITENSANILHSWYNSFQANYGHQFKYDVSFHAAYTFSKTMQSGNQIDAINRIYGRNISGNDVPNIISLSGVYTLPVGRGHLLLGNANRIVDGIIGGWQAAHIYNYVQGYPWSLGTNWSIKSPIAVHQHNIAPGSVALPATYTRLNAVSPCIGYVNQDSGEIVLEPIAIAEGCATAKAVMDPPNYAVAKNVVYSGVRIPSEHQFDVSLSKSFDVYERMKLHVRVDALNVLNHPIWQDNYVTTATSLDFGSIREGGGDSTTSVARQIQLSAKLTF